MSALVFFSKLTATIYFPSMYSKESRKFTIFNSVYQQSGTRIAHFLKRRSVFKNITRLSLGHNELMELL